MEETINIITQGNITHGNGVTPILRLYDRNTPIVVLFGPRVSGKKTALLSLAHFLECEGYIVNPVQTLLPDSDIHYSYWCKRFREMVYSSYSEPHFLGFMLVDILKQDGHKVCQILVVPGDLCFDSEDLTNTMSACINQIIYSPNPKVWIPFIEANWGTNQEIRSHYIQQLGVLRANSRLHDKFIVLINKVDKLTFMFHGIHIDMKCLINYVLPQYDAVHVFKETGPLKLFKPYICDFIPFTSGTFHRSTNGKDIWCRSNPIYTKSLWKAIIKCLK